MKTLKKQTVSLLDIKTRLLEIDFPKVDYVVGIETGGIEPAKLIAEMLNCNVQFVRINYRDDYNRPRFDHPIIIQNRLIYTPDDRILLVDDVSVSGKTLDTAKDILKNCEIKTFVLKGNADLVLFPELKECVNWPWKKNTISKDAFLHV